MSAQMFIIANLIDGEHQYTGRIPIEIIEDPSGFVREHVKFHDPAPGESRIPSGSTMTDDGHIHIELDFIPVEERLPEEDDRIIKFTYAPLSGITMAYRDRQGRWILSWGGPNAVVAVTHWAEIPVIKT